MSSGSSGSAATRRGGRWLVPRLIEGRVGSGHVVLDFAEAVITQPLLHIDAEVRSGTLTPLTGPGIEVDADDVAVRTSGTVKIHKSRGSWRRSCCASRSPASSRQVTCARAGAVCSSGVVRPGN
jgi:hypothetical protein